MYIFKIHCNALTMYTTVSGSTLLMHFGCTAQADVYAFTWQTSPAVGWIWLCKIIDVTTSGIT